MDFGFFVLSLSTPDRSRTCNLRFRRPTLYPIELRVQLIFRSWARWPAGQVANCTRTPSYRKEPFNP